MQNWLAQLVSDSRNSTRTVARARGLSGWAWCIGIGPGEESSSALPKIDEAISIFEEWGDKKGLAYALRIKAAISAWMGEPTGGIPMLEQSLNLSREISDKPGIANSLLWLGFAPYAHETPRKLKYLQESLLLWRELGDATGIIEALKQLGAIELRQGNFSLAHTWLDEALSLLQKNIRYLENVITISYDVGDLAFYEGDYALAGKYYQDCLDWAERVGSTVSIGYAKVRLGFLALRLADLPQAADYLRQALIIFHKRGHTHGLALTLDWLASLAVVERRWRKATVLFAYTGKQYEQILGPRPPVEQKDMEKDLALIRSQLSQAEWNALSTQGSSLTSAEAIQLALT